MEGTRTDIIAQLQKEILPLQGFKAAGTYAVQVNLGAVNDAFPNNIFPAGAIHEFISGDKETSTSSAGFIAGILGLLMQSGGVIVWISSSPMLFPPALTYYGIDPSRLVVVQVPKEKDLLWVAEEALKCEGLAGVVVEMRELDFTASRRLQLIVERSRVTGFILRQSPRRHVTTASIARWKITPLGSISPGEGLPGVGFPCWKVELLKVRNGKPGCWELQWNGKNFEAVIREATQIIKEEKRKAG